MTRVTSGDYVVRAIRPAEWEKVRGLRLDALRDPAARSCQKRSAFAAGSGEGSATAQQFIAELPDGSWAGSLTVLIEEAGTEDWAGFPVERRQGHVVGVYVRPEHRGNGLIKAMFDAGVSWAWGRGAERVRLLVHEDNERAQGAYRKAGFRPSGVRVPFVKDAAQNELEFVLDR
ncbi:GNAT family N-acetyltransferase [Streptomyces murinus]|uniref:GNAT family N-acetyltransferase n=1 Tax=Streptomyces murinus TaxID=33900 RepID=UPI001ABEF54B|nr:GNAT family N-acetyltransferase [Streptomyces murinus]